MAEIELPGGHILLVDDEDWEVLRGLTWSAFGSGKRTRYAVTYAQKKNGFYRVIRMHRLIALAKTGQIVDHKNGNGLDNRRQNLRLCTAAENSRNSRSRKNTSSEYKGVWRIRNRWVAGIRVNGVRTMLGRFVSEIEAAAAYDAAAIRLHGDFARLNFPQQSL